MSGYGNHATMQGITYEKGPLDNPGRSARVTKNLSSIIEVHEFFPGKTACDFSRGLISLMSLRV